jgi:outer membrane protein OmpA-like peptidoglycan-associated protein
MRRITTIAAGGALAALLALPTAAAADTYPTRAGELLFSDDSGQIWSIPYEGGTKTPVGSATGTVGNWSPDGSRFAVSEQDETTGYHVASTYAADGTGYTRIGSQFGNPIGGPAFVPGGLAVAAAGDGVYRIGDASGWKGDKAVTGRVTSSSDGKLVWQGTGGLVIEEHGVSRPLVGPGYESQPSLAQNGKLVAFVSTRNDEPDIYAFDPNAATGIEGGDDSSSSDGPTDYPIAASPTSAESLPAVSPDGSRIAFVSNRGGTGALWIAAADGTGQPEKVAGSDLGETTVTGLAWRPAALPKPTIDSAPAAQTKDVRPTVTFHGTTATAECSFEGGAWLPCDGTWKPETDLVDGTYTLKVRMVDADLVPGTVAEVTWTVDTEAPAEPQVDSRPDELAATGDAWIAFTGAEDGGRFECLVDGQAPSIKGDDEPAWGACASPLSLTGLADGAHALKLRQVDAAGNAGAPATVAWTVDTGIPAKPLLVKAPGVVTAATTAAFELAGEPDARFECRLDGKSVYPAAIGGKHWYKCQAAFAVEGLAEGEHVLEFRQVDDAGNASEAATFAWTVDTTAPAAPVVTTGPMDGTATSATFALGGEKGAAFEYRLDGGEWVKAPAAFELTGLAAGRHTIALRQRDAAGNAGPETTLAWTIAAPPAPAPVATPAPAPKFTATVEDKQTQSGAATVTVERKSVQVGCQMTGVALAACKVDIYANVDADGKVLASGRVLVGTGIVEADGKTNKLAVRVVLNAKGRELLRRNPQGLDVSVAITGTPVSGAPIKTTGNARLVAKRSRVLVGGFAVNSPKLTAAAKRELRKLAEKLAGGATVKVVGHTDGSSDSARYLQRLGRARANTVKAFLAANGAKATYTVITRGAQAPRATNATKAGRALNRRVVLQIVR